jgi:CDP-diacylglycerol---glycerol-3-phosphate 3-phosphatidyltransferase
MTPNDAGKDFHALRQSGAAVGTSESIGMAFVRARDRVAARLIRLGATPNRVTIVGFLFTCAAAFCLARGASFAVPYFRFGTQPTSWWPAIAAVFLILAGACDMLDGAVARVGRMGSRSGAVLDSSVDRFSDMAIYIGCFLHFALMSPANLTYQLLAVIALCNGVMISYVKARAEEMIEDCSVGYWLRGERFAAVLIGCMFGHIPAVMWQMAVSCAFTVWRRMSYAYLTVQALDAGKTAPPHGPVPGFLGRIQLWRHPRGSIGYDFVTGAHIAYIIFAPCVWAGLWAVGQYGDPLRRWLGY